MKARTTGAYVLIALGAVAVAVVAFSRGTALEAIFPVERARRAFSDKVWSRVKGACRGAAASAENVALRREVAALALAREDAARLEAENERLRRVLEYREREPKTWLAAAVLVGGGVVPEGLVGRVESVTPHTAEIRLVTDPSLGVGCEVSLPGGGVLRGTLAGGTDERLVMKHILSAAEVPPRSPVFTSGLGGIYPKGIAVGTLLEVRKDSDSPRREGEVLPAVDFATLRDVFIRREK